jgi:hypothetical protein
MANTTSQISICNRALQINGYQPITSITDGSRGSRAMLRAYQPVLLRLLRSKFWNFSIQRASLTASAVTPAFGPAFYFPLPPDYLMMAPPDQRYGVAYGGYISGPPNVNDYQIEQMPGEGGSAIVSDQASPINIRYVSQNVTEGLFDPSFAEAFAALLAVETCEELTQSSSKLQQAGKIYDDAMEDAKQRNAFEQRPMNPPIDSWITQRF